MEKKNFLIKNIFYIFFALCFFSFGLLTLNKIPTDNVLAEDVSSEDATKTNSNVPDFFLREEFVHTDRSSEPDKKNDNSLIADDTFAYFNESGTSNYLKLSLNTNGENVGSEIYNHVYYPNKDDTSNFHFYTVEHYALTIDGVDQNLGEGFKHETDFSFENLSSTIKLHEFSMILNDRGKKDSNEFKITDDEGNVKEGLYSLTLRIVLFTCNDGKLDGSEEKESFAPEKQMTINYNFYVVAQKSYLTNNRPNITSGAFDNEVTYSTGSVAYNLFSNYTSKAGTGSATGENQIPYVEYDFTRFDLNVQKELAGALKKENLLFDKDSGFDIVAGTSKSSTVVSSGDEIVHFELKPNNICRVYFKDVGVYTVTPKAIKIAKGDGKIRKHTLDAISGRTRKVTVNMFGYQLGYTDFDQAPDVNNNRPVEELKTPNYVEGTFAESADVTSSFVKNLDPSSPTTFTKSKIVAYLDGKTPVSTDQTPIKFTTNASLIGNSSYVLTTRSGLQGFAPLNGTTLDEKTLYEKKFTGQAENAEGTYIYIIAYTYKDYVNAESIFYQVFYFEIDKSSPKVELKTDETTETSTPISSNTFINKNAVLADIANKPYNKDITIQIYAEDYSVETDTPTYLADFGGENGISMAKMIEKGTTRNAYEVDGGEVKLQANAKYTIRLYYTNAISNTNINEKTSLVGLANEQVFTIDQNKISIIKGRNVSEVNGGYQILNDMTTFTTNQNMVISWETKKSGASSYAYYRYFPLETAQYYSKDASNVSSLLGKNMLAQTSDFLPVNNVLNLQATTNNWIPLASGKHNGGNTENFANGTIISTEYVLSEAGLYLVDVFDEAGNHKIEAFLIDNSAPTFAIRNNKNEYSIAKPTEYIDTSSTLYWGDYKAIYVANFNTELYRNYNPTTLQKSVLENAEANGFYTDKDGNISLDIYKSIYENLYGSHMQYIECRTATRPSDISPLVTSYSGMYMTIKINDVAYYADDGTEGNYILQPKLGGKNQKRFEVGEDDLTYSLLVRDLSNTKLDLTNNDETAPVQYTSHFSARQTVKISFDESEFTITFKNRDKKDEELLTFLSEEEVDGDKRTKTSYFNPTRMKKAFTLSFIPTTPIEGGSSVQVDKVTIDYYRFIDQKETINGVNYYYSTLSTTPETSVAYDMNVNGPSSKFTYNIGYSNAEQITNPGKYVITRTYKDGEGYSCNSKDFFKRTFVLIVDRSGVISDPVSPTTADDGHTESLVGGDIFVSMFDNGKNSNIVVTFPNSEAGNTDGTTLYNNGSVKTILTSNKLPVNIYVPQYKYTKYVTVNKTLDKNGNETSYDYSITNNDVLNNFKDGVAIKEYTLFAQLFKDGTDSSNLIAQTQNSLSPETDEGGFLKFFDTNGQALAPITTPGQYYVTIYQGYNSVQGENCYKQSITFKFEIKSAQPDFLAKQDSGESLYCEDSSSSEYSQIYYTNNPEVCLVWDASTDKYMVQIDVDKISLKTKNGTIYTPSSDIWTEAPYKQENNSYFAQLNLEKLSGVYQNDGWVDITMQFENQDEEQVLYKPVTKRIYVDLSAPTSNINNLVEKSISGTSINSLTENALRVYKTAQMQTATTFNETSFNVSNPNGTFAYYSYSVTPDFVDTLKGTQEHKTYVRKFKDEGGNSTKYHSGVEQETDPSKFLTSNFDELMQVSALDGDTYYEIVETDKAGNMTIYTIYVVDNAKNYDLISYVSYVDGKGTDTAYDVEKYNISTEHSGAIHNIYSQTGLSLSGINFFGDEWAQIKLKTYNSNGGLKSNMTLLLTPNDKTYALAFVGDSAPERVAITSLIDGSVGSLHKNVMSIYNRASGETENFYFTIYNTSLTSSLTNQEDKEFIQFKKVADENIQSTELGETYLTSLKITAYNSNSDQGDVIYDEENLLGYASGWKSNSSINVTAKDEDDTLTFELRPELNFTPNATRIIYEFTDNYGETYKEIHIYRESVIKKEVSSKKDLYAFIQDGTLYYITENDFQYTYNPSKYVVKVYDKNGNEVQGKDDPNPNGTKTLTIVADKTAPYYDEYVLDIRDANNEDETTNFVKNINFILLNQLPTAMETGTTVGAGQFMLLDANGTNVTKKIVGTKVDASGYFSEVRVVYNLDSTFIPVKYSISTDKINWTEISSGTRLRSVSGDLEKYYLKVWYDETYLENEHGSFAYVFGKVLPTKIYEFSLSALSTSYWVEMNVGGVTSIVERSGLTYHAKNGAEYANHYIVNLDYETNSGSVEIKVNDEQDIDKTRILPVFTDGNVTSELWHIKTKETASTGVPKFETYIVISYVPPSDNFVKEFYASNINGIIEKDNENANLISKTSSSLVVSQDYSSVDKVQLRWSKYYGYQQNEIKINLIKDGIKLYPQIYTMKDGTEDYNYTYLTYSGKYTISFSDLAGNVQKFNAGSSGQSETFTFIFLKDVPFTVTYTNPETGKSETTLPIKQAVYNGSVTLNIDEATRSEFYKFGGYPTISVKKNGVEYAKEFSENETSFTFDEAGYYEVSFTATSKDAGDETIRQETYQFTIMSAEEHKISYVYNQYSNYYVEKVVKDGQDITAQLLKLLDLQTIIVDGKEYLTQLPISYLDEKTGVGVYTITINSNNKLLGNSSLKTNWTFKLTINRGTAPLQISLGEGGATTSAISVKFNQSNLYSEMGECTLRIVRQNDNGSLSLMSATKINSQSTSESAQTIDQNGTYFVQVVSPSGTIMFSYKVTKNAPMNAASIIAIVISAIVLVAVIFIIIKLRKRISVK